MQVHEGEQRCDCNALATIATQIFGDSVIILRAQIPVWKALKERQSSSSVIQMVKSSSVAMWPIWVVINELPVKMRYLWLSLHIFQEKYVFEAINYISKWWLNDFILPIGVEVSTPQGNITIKAPIVVICLPEPSCLIWSNSMNMDAIYVRMKE